MGVLNLLYLYFFVALNWSIINGDDSTITPPSILQPNARTLSCSEGFSDGKLNLTCSGFTRIPTPNETNTNNEDILILDMSGKNHMQIIKIAEFHNAKFINVNKLKMDNCNIRTIESRAFLDLESLVEVHLQNNRIETLNMEMFENNDKLQILLLSGNQIHQFLGTQFPKLPLLKKIDLKNGRITVIPAHAFANLDSLQELNLMDNKISRLNWNIFPNTKKLTHIYLANNNWACDCHMRFLQAYLKEMGSGDIASIVICKEPERFADKPLSTISKEELICPPQITALTLIGSDNPTPQDGDLIVYAESGKYIALDCAVDGYPEPEIIWTKDNLPINETGRKIQDSNTGRGMRPEFQHTFAKHFAIFNTSKDDIGSYECTTYHKGSSAYRVVQNVFLNLTNIQDEVGEIIVDGGGGRTWLWILLALLILLIIALCIVGILIWRKKENQRQLKYRSEMLNKFKVRVILTEMQLKI